MDFILDPSLVLYLPLYELDGSSLMSKDKHGHLATVTGALWTPQGRSLDGTDDYVDAGIGSSLDVTDAITLEAWIKPTAWMTYYQRILAKANNPSTIAYDFSLEPTTNKLSFHIAEADHASSLAPSLNLWSHVVVTFDESTDKIVFYLNGQVDTPITEIGSIVVYSGTSLYIGNLKSLARYWNGFIGEVRICNRALSLLEVQRNYLATKWRYQ